MFTITAIAKDGWTLGLNSQDLIGSKWKPGNDIHIPHLLVHRGSEEVLVCKTFRMLIRVGNHMEYTEI